MGMQSHGGLLGKSQTWLVWAITRSPGHHYEALSYREETNWNFQVAGSLLNRPRDHLKTSDSGWQEDIKSNAEVCSRYVSGGLHILHTATAVSLDDQTAS